MPAYTSPGVYVNEAPLKANIQTNAGATAAAFIGTAARGPVAPQLINDWSSYTTIFGALEDQYDLGYAVYHYFTNGGRSCWVSRVVAAAAVTAAADEAGTNAVEWDPDTLGDVTLFEVTANSPGVWGNSLAIKTLAGTIPATATNFPNFHFVVELDGVEVERWIDCEIDPAHPRYVQNVVNSYSSFVTVSNVNPGGAVPNVDAALPAAVGGYPLALGSDGTVADGDYDTSVAGLAVTDGPLLINIPAVTTTSVITAAVAFAGTRGDSFVIIDTSKADTTKEEVMTTAANFANVNPSSYGAVYGPALIMIDPARRGVSSTRITAPGGAIAGLFIRTEIERNIAKAPAGYNSTIRGALAPAFKVSDADIGVMYVGATPVNSFKAIPGAGVSVNGARTIAKTTPDKFIPVRRTLNHLKYHLKDITQYAPFEPNDARLWQRLSQDVSSYLGNFWRAGGLAGARSSEAFYVVCNRSNNTDGTIANGEVHVEVGVALSSPAEFVVINLSQWTGGAAQATES